MSNIINSEAYVKQGDKVYKVNGGAPIHTFNSVDEMNAANLADGSIACVPSANNVLDLTKYKFDDGQSFNDKIFVLFLSGETHFEGTDDGSFWVDMSKVVNPILKIDMSLMAKGSTAETAVSMVSKTNGEAVYAMASFTANSGGQLTKVNVEFGTSLEYATGERIGSYIKLNVEAVNG